MVSGAISWWGKTRLVFLDKGLKITGAEYLDTLQHYHIPDCRELFEGGWVLLATGIVLECVFLVLPFTVGCI